MAVFEELQAGLGEQGHGEHVVDGVLRQLNILLLRLVLHIGFQLRQLRLQQVRRAAGDGFCPFQHPRLQGGVHRRRRVAVLTFQNARRFFSDGFVALAGQDVEHRLGADNLRGRGDQRDEAEVLAHAGDFRQHFIQTVGGILLLQLAFEVGEHPARDLGDQNAAVGALQLALEGVVLLTHLAEVRRDALQLVDIQPGVILRAGEGGHQRLGGRVAVGGAHRGNGGIDAVDAGFNGLQQGHLRHAGGGVAVQVQGDGKAFFDFADQLKGGAGGENAGHVFNRDGVDAGLQQLFGEVEPGLQGVGRAGGVAQGALGVGAVAADRLQGGLHVARVVHGVEDAEDVHAVFDGALHEAFDHVVGVVTVAEQVLAAEQHLQRGLRHRLFQLAQADPRVLAEEADAGVEGGAAPALKRAVADVVKLSGDGEHIVETQTGGEQGLVGVAQDDIGNGNGHEFLRELRVKTAVVVNGGDNRRL
ncbi:hypothetical protein SB01124_04112 [Klebsiella quasipneumoniae subsp. quasipneumoniae]|nr:hypothetical protein SB01124_04112 [Klebsiella quasipneumoniae subsp. quasipneumoniae]